MAAPGVPVDITVTVTEPPGEIWPMIIEATAGIADYGVTTSTDDLIVLTRGYTPTWAIVAGGPASGLSQLARRYDEVVVINITPGVGGTTLQVTGTASEEMAQKLDEVTMSGVWLHPVRQAGE
jgi:hypothetical protein